MRAIRRMVDAFGFTTAAIQLVTLLIVAFICFVIMLNRIPWWGALLLALAIFMGGFWLWMFVARLMGVEPAASVALPDSPFVVISLHEEGWFRAGGRDPNEGYVRLGIEATQRVERVFVRAVEVYEVAHGALLRLADVDPVNLVWGSSETQAVEDRQFLNLSPDGVQHIVDVAVCGRAGGSTNIRLIGARDNRPALPAARYKIVLVVSSDSADNGSARLEYGLYRLDRVGLGTTLILQEWEAIGEALIEATRS